MKGRLRREGKQPYDRLALAACLACLNSLLNSLLSAIFTDESTVLLPLLCVIMLSIQYSFFSFTYLR